MLVRLLQNRHRYLHLNGMLYHRLVRLAHPLLHLRQIRLILGLPQIILLKLLALILHSRLPIKHKLMSLIRLKMHQLRSTALLDPFLRISLQIIKQTLLLILQNQ